MNLVIDEGNTKCKCAWFENNQLQKLELKEEAEIFNTFFWENTEAEKILLSSVKRNRKDFFDFLGSGKPNIYFLDHLSHLPIKVNYATPQTLGNDRIAGAVAANDLYPNQNVLVIDAGTCITYDFVSAENCFEGGGISPGLHMRLKALHNYTARLPLITDLPKDTDTPLVGNSTQQSMLSGVINGIKAEVKALTEAYQKEYLDVKTLITGGDAFLFETNAKNNIFAQPNLVMHGLYKILSHNASL